MSDNTTRDMPGGDARSFEERIFARLDAMDASFNTRFDTLEKRLTALEDKVDARLRETRPMWEAMQVQLKEIAASVDDVNSQLREVLADLFRTRGRVAKLEERERPPAA